MNKQPIVYGFALKRSIKNTKITFAVLLLFILQGIVGNVYAQEKKISISVKNEKLETVLRMVEKQTNYLFFYDSDEINKQQRITLAPTTGRSASSFTIPVIFFSEPLARPSLFAEETLGFLAKMI